MPHRPLFNSFSALASLAIPGLGQALKGHWPVALCFQGALLGGIILICQSRIIVAPWGMETLALLVVLIHFASAFSAARLSLLPGRPVLRALVTTSFMAASIGLGLTLFSARASLLGVNVYYVPSASMSPTLLPGDLILVNTIAYKQRRPQLEEVVVFSLPNNRAIIHVKRINEQTTEGLYTMRGDNRSASLDSRYYGEVPFQNLHGKVVRFIRYRPHSSPLHQIMLGYIHSNRSL